MDDKWIPHMVICSSSATHLPRPVLSGTCMLMSVDVQYIHWGVLCLFKITSRQPTDNSLLVIHSLSIPNPFGLVFVQYLSGTHAFISVHIRQSSVCVSQCPITIGHIMDKKKWINGHLPHIYHKCTAQGTTYVADNYRLNCAKHMMMG